MYFPIELWLKIKDYTFDYQNYYKKMYLNSITHFENLFEFALCFPNVNFYTILPTAIKWYNIGVSDIENKYANLTAIEIDKINELPFVSYGHTIGNMRCSVYYGWSKKI